MPRVQRFLPAAHSLYGEGRDREQRDGFSLSLQSNLCHRCLGELDVLSLQQHTQVLYEIALDIGGSIDLEVMLKKSMRTMLRKLNCLGAAVFADRYDGERYRPKEVFALPRNFRNNAAYSVAISKLSTSEEPETGRTYWPDPKPYSVGNAYYYLFDLPGFGVLVLLRAHSLDPPLALSLSPICNKLAESCIVAKLPPP